EANINTGLISYTSPIARALISKTEGDAVEFKAPDGEKSYELIEVSYD
ncbi:MAG: GreA/GreB family elongation factor, partial [Woeseiaceae bacterium]|nr:GreA/GreB family elongation factor [Woeseiaceae bacterium]